MTKVIDLSNVPEAVSVIDYLSKLSYETEAMKNIVTEIMIKSKNDVTILESEVFKKYHDNYTLKNTEYEIAKMEFQDNFIPRELAGPSTVWNLTYNNYMLEIKY